MGGGANSTDFRFFICKAPLMSRLSFSWQANMHYIAGFKRSWSGHNSRQPGNPYLSQWQFGIAPTKCDQTIYLWVSGVDKDGVVLSFVINKDIRQVRLEMGILLYGIKKNPCYSFCLRFHRVCSVRNHSHNLITITSSEYCSFWPPPSCHHFVISPISPTPMSSLVTFWELTSS